MTFAPSLLAGARPAVSRHLRLLLPGLMTAALCGAAWGVGEPDPHARALSLFKEQEQARHKSGGPWWFAQSGLELCAASRHLSTRERECQGAQRRVDACLEARATWEQRRTALLADIAKDNPQLGKSYTPGMSPLRGVGPQPDADQLWNDTVRALGSLTMPACPSTLPGTSLGPAAALEQWVAEDAAPPVALPRRGGNLGTERFREANETATRDAATPGGRDARLKAEREAHQRLAEELAAKPNFEEILLSVVSATMGAAGMPTQLTPSHPVGNALVNALAGPSSAAPDSALSSDPDASRARPSGGGLGCEEALNSLVGPMLEGRPPSQGPGYTQAQDAEQGVWQMQAYLRAANAIPACAGSSARHTVAGNLAQSQQECRRSGGGNCSQGRNYYVNAAQIEAAIQRLAQPHSAAGAAEGASALTGATVTAGSGGDCRTELQRQEADFQSLQARSPSGGSAVAAMQVVLYMTSERVALLDRLCQGQPEYRDRASIQQTKDATRRNCLSIATSASSCVPRRPS